MPSNKIIERRLVRVEKTKDKVLLHLLDMCANGYAKPKKLLVWQRKQAKK